MTERGSLDPIRGIARSSTDGPPPGLAAPMQALVTAAVPSRDRSLPGALCAVAGEAVDEDVAALESVVDAVTHLEGYVRLRLALVTDEPSVRGLEPVDVLPMEPASRDGRGTDSAPSIDRDAAILASDFLHAGAYARVAQVPVSDRHRLECHRLLAEGSTALAHRFLSLSRTDGDEPAGSAGSIDSSGSTAAFGRYGAAATLAETAAAIGSAAAGASTETRTALRTYSHALMTALASQSAAVADDIDPRASAVRVLTDETARYAVADDREPDSTTPVEHCLDRARDALETLGSSDEIDEGSTGNPDGDASTPLARLERATRVPFRHDWDDR